jgi:hypothetical protein
MSTAPARICSGTSPAMARRGDAGPYAESSKLHHVHAPVAPEVLAPGLPKR